MKNLIVATVALGLLMVPSVASAHSTHKTHQPQVSPQVEFTWVWIPARRVNGVRVAGHWKRMAVAPIPQPATRRRAQRRNHRYRCGC